MSKKIVVVNAGPRKGWNTDILLSEASDGAVSAGAEIQRFDLFKLERHTGCISCFGCKRENEQCTGYDVFGSCEQLSADLQFFCRSL